MTDSFRLVMTQGPEPGRTFTLDRDSVRLGRDPACDVVVDHPQVSRQHTRLDLRGGVVVLEDLGSTNGTFVNGVRLTTPHVLANGDTVGLGDTVTFTFHGPAVQAEETLVGRPGAVPTMPTPPPPAPTYQMPPPAAEPAYPPPYIPPYPEVPTAPPRRRRTGLWVGCGCLVVLVIVACVGVFLLDYLNRLPDFFYLPLQWLGLG